MPCVRSSPQRIPPVSGYNDAVGTQPSRKPVFPPQIAPYIDVAAYLLDARAPAATLYLEKLLSGKELLLLTRAGQAEARATTRWRKFFLERGYPCLVIDSVKRTGIEEVLDYLADLLKRKQALAARRGIVQTTLRMVALGVPNVGKSTFLNTLIGRRRFKTGDKPGITRGHQWVRLFDDVEILDTPGVLRDPAQLNRRKPAWMLLNLLPYDAALREEVVELLSGILSDTAWEKLRRYYKVPADKFRHDNWLELLECLAAREGRKPDSDDEIDRACRRLIRDFQRGRFGRITLEQAGRAQISSENARSEL